MRRQPIHYPKWLRDILYNPNPKFCGLLSSHPERNCALLEKIMHNYRIADPKDALLFDIAIEQEKQAIHNQEIVDRVQLKFNRLSERLEQSETRVKQLESSLKKMRMTLKKRVKK